MRKIHKVIRKIAIAGSICFLFLLLYVTFWGNTLHTTITNTAALGAVDPQQQQPVTGTKLQISPVSNSWTHPNYFDVVNKDTVAVTIQWNITCDDLSKCSASSGSTTLNPNQTVRYGVGGVCTTWAYHLTAPVKVGYNSFPDNYSCSQPPKIMPTPVPLLCNGNCVPKEAGNLDAFNNFSPLTGSVQQNQSFWTKLTIKGQDMPPSPQATPQGGSNANGTITVDQVGGAYCNNAAGQISITGKINVASSVYKPKLRVNIATVKTTDRKAVDNYKWYLTSDGDTFTLSGQWPGVQSGDPLVELWFELSLNDYYYTDIGAYKNIAYYWNPTDCASGGSGTVARIGSTITVDEEINSANFQINSLNNSNFKLMKNGSDVTSSLCAGLTCLTKASTSKFTLTLPSQTAAESVIAYFSVNAATATGGTNVKLNEPSGKSKVTYGNGYSESVGNTDVGVLAPQPYFNSQNYGDVYSRGSISDPLSKNDYILDPGAGILYYNATLALGSGDISIPRWTSSNYTPKQNNSYSPLFNIYKSRLALTTISSLSSISTPGYYMADTANLVIGGTGWDGKVFSGGKSVVFVNGDLYIKKSSGNSFSIAKDGKSALVFIVAGKMGIDPSVTKIEGLYIVDGVIDTLCTAPISGSNATCSPDKTSLQSNSQLTLEGAYYSAQTGFKLERTGTAGGNPAETFVYRPDLILSTTDILGLKIYSWKENTR